MILEFFLIYIIRKKYICNDERHRENDRISNTVYAFFPPFSCTNMSMCHFSLCRYARCHFPILCHFVGDSPPAPPAAAAAAGEEPAGGLQEEASPREALKGRSECFHTSSTVLRVSQWDLQDTTWYQLKDSRRRVCVCENSLQSTRNSSHLC